MTEDGPAAGAMLDVSHGRRAGQLVELLPKVVAHGNAIGAVPVARFGTLETDDDLFVNLEAVCSNPR